MEFYINHTCQEIARVPADEWEEDDDMERMFVNFEDEEDFFVMVKLIDDYEYTIDAEDSKLFMNDIYNERKIIEQYDAMIKQSEDDSNSVGSWDGWDEVGASFDY